MRNFLSLAAAVLFWVANPAADFGRPQAFAQPPVSPAGQDCSSEFKPSEVTEKFKPSDLRPQSQTWMKLKQKLEKNIKGLRNPFEQAGQNADAIGRVFRTLKEEFPTLQTAMEIENGHNLDHAEYVVFKRAVGNALVQVSRQPKSKLQSFAALEALRLLAKVESRVVFPKTSEELKKEEQDDPEQQPEEEDEEEQDPEWNKTKEQYSPENKDLSQRGGKQKNAEILWTDATVLKRLFRQKIYDDFDLNRWYSISVQRENIQKSTNPAKTLVINPLNESMLVVPLPYGYSIQPQVTADYRVEEVGPGEFELHLLPSNQKKPVVLPLVSVLSEPKGLVSDTDERVAATLKKELPPNLWLFAQSLKGLSAVDAATKLEKYLAEDGGFLYYSVGDKISKEQLAEISGKYNSLIQFMSKPMAMANVGAFNCDGAAWIGSLILRHLLGHPVRVSAGRTSAGTRKIEGVPFQVVRSSDPAHAWLEVYDGRHWLPFDMTPKNNLPDMESAPNELEQERDEADEKDQERQKSPPKSDTQKDQQNKKGPKSQGEADGQDSSENENEESDTEQERQAQANESEQEKAKQEQAKKDQKSDTSDAEEEFEESARKIEDLLKVKSTQRTKNESQSSLIEKILARIELIFIENLIHEGHVLKFKQEAFDLYLALAKNPLWSNAVERSKSKMIARLDEAKFNEFKGLGKLLAEVRAEFLKDQPRVALHKLRSVKTLLETLADVRTLTSIEVQGLNAIQQILMALAEIKHQHAQEFDLIERTLAELPGNISHQWIKKQYGDDYRTLGSAASMQLANDIKTGRLKPLLQMGVVRDFVDMALNSMPEPRWKEEPTLNRSLVPKSRQDLVVTRSPLDFAKMLWNLRPGEPIFAPTLQGRQFAIGSLETRRVPDPKKPIERKVSVVYYDISGSMKGDPLESVDALLMAFADHALSEVDAIGRPTHEIYLIPFEESIHAGVHISSRDDALNFIAHKMQMRTAAQGGTNIQAAVEHFYSLVGNSFRAKASQGREKLFQKANMVLFTDGGSTIDMRALEQARQQIPAEVEVSINFVSIGNSVNETLETLAKNSKLSTKKPTFRKMDEPMMTAVVGVSAEYDPEAFATEERMNGRLLAKIQVLLQKLTAVDPRLSVDKAQSAQTISRIQAHHGDISQFSGLREAAYLAQLPGFLAELKIDPTHKARVLEGIIQVYPQVVGRSWNNMTLPEQEAFEKLYQWTLRP